MCNIIHIQLVKKQNKQKSCIKHLYVILQLTTPDQSVISYSVPCPQKQADSFIYRRDTVSEFALDDFEIKIIQTALKNYFFVTIFKIHFLVSKFYYS